MVALLGNLCEALNYEREIGTKGKIFQWQKPQLIFPHTRACRLHVELALWQILDNAGSTITSDAHTHDLRPDSRSINELPAYFFFNTMQRSKHFYCV